MKIIDLKKISSQDRLKLYGRCWAQNWIRQGFGQPLRTTGYSAKKRLSLPDYVFFTFLIAFGLVSGCVSDKYPTMNADGTQRQPWGDNDNFWPYHWRCSQEGRQIIEHNRRVERYHDQHPSTRDRR